MSGIEGIQVMGDTKGGKIGPDWEIVLDLWDTASLKIKVTLITTAVVMALGIFPTLIMCL